MRLPDQFSVGLALIQQALKSQAGHKFLYNELLRQGHLLVSHDS